MKVTEQNYPTVFKAFRQIQLDNGCINRLEPAREAYEVPELWEAFVADTEVSLKRLDDDELETFCCGEQLDRQAIGVMYAFPQFVDWLLEAFFDEWED